MRLLDRYVLQNFLIPFLYSTLGFLAIWLVFDLSDNGHDFIEAHVKLKDARLFLSHAIPADPGHLPARGPPAGAALFPEPHVAVQ
jgi:lipopolysaccharide export LptBFGC system permease protein LptF